LDKFKHNRGEEMYKKLGVAIIHGMGNQKQDFADEMVDLIKKQFAKKLECIVTNPSSYLVFQPIQWSSVFEEREEKLYENVVLANDLDFKGLRKFTIQYVGDVIAYQQVETSRQNYERVHELIGKHLNIISNKAGKDVPLCVISHSLGSVIASNYFYDLQAKRNSVSCIVNESSPLENGLTLTLFYTLGTALPLWSLRYHNFNRPINIPSKELQQYYPGLKGEWINFYDKDDVLGFPLRDVDQTYLDAVTEDRQVNIGGLLTSWNPFCHTGYFKNMEVIDRIVDGLVRTWKQVNKIEKI
jgi:hypothetical protein